MKKVNEMKINGEYVKYYKNVSGSIDPVAFLRRLQDNGFTIGTILLEEDAEADMKIDAGEYTFDRFCAAYSSIKKRAAYLIRTTVECAGSEVSVNINDGSSVMYIETADSDIELTDLIGKE